MSEFAEWDSFYVIVGSAAGALIGLQFVVLTLIAESPPLRAAEAGAAFATPTIVHFGTALLLSALRRVPWQSIILAAALLVFIGLGGVAYAVVVARRMRRQTVYRPEFEDWLFHALLPLAAYAMLALSAFAAPSHTREALFGVGAASLLLLFIGIHNSWDSVAYHVFVKKRDANDRAGQRKYRGPVSAAGALTPCLASNPPLDISCVRVSLARVEKPRSELSRARPKIQFTALVRART